MTITYYDASCFKVQTGETVIAIDPPAKDSDFKSPRFGTDIVLISAENKNYNSRDLPPKTSEEESPFIINGKGEYEIKGIHVKGVGNGNLSNVIYVLEIEDVVLCHLGAFGNNEFNPTLKEEIGEIDILFVPISGEELLDAQKAANVATHLGPKIIVPMHYKEDQLKQFAKEMGGIPEALEKLTIKRKDLADKKTEIIVLKSVV